MRVHAGGVQGKGTRDLGEKSSVTAEVSYVNRQYIVIDNYEGKGEDFKPRQCPLVMLTNGDKEYSLTFDELAELLEKNKNK